MCCLMCDPWFCGRTAARGCSVPPSGGRRCPERVGTTGPRASVLCQPQGLPWGPELWPAFGTVTEQPLVLASDPGASAPTVHVPRRSAQGPRTPTSTRRTRRRRKLQIPGSGKLGRQALRLEGRLHAPTLRIAVAGCFLSAVRKEHAHLVKATHLEVVTMLPPKKCIQTAPPEIS